MRKVSDREYRELSERLIDTRKEPGWRTEAAQARRTCRWLDKAAALYGARRVERLLLKWGEDGAIVVVYWRRWRARDRAHVVPFGVISEPSFPQVNIAAELAVSPRLAA
jgi:hypothetical protein